MDKKTIAITGAASGIGRATALLFAQRGWFVGIFDVNQKGLQRLEMEIGASNCFTAEMDVIQTDSVRQAMTSLSQKTDGRLDCLLNNAGILSFGLFKNTDLDIHHRIVDVNIKGCLNCIYYAFEYLKNTQGAGIINMSSASANYGAPDLAVYSATKHAVRAMTEALDLEFEKEGISVCDIMPPYVNTPMLADQQDAYSLKKMGIRLTPEKVAQTVWRAAHSRKLHWEMRSAPLISLLFRLLPSLQRAAVRKIALPSN